MVYLAGIKTEVSFTVPMRTFTTGAWDIQFRNMGQEYGQVILKVITPPQSGGLDGCEQP